MLQAFENYIPLPETENELVNMIRKMNNEVWKGKVLAENAVQTALAVGDLLSFHRYNSDSLWCFYLGAEKCAERFRASPCKLSQKD